MIVKARGIRGANIPTRAKLTYFQENYLQLDLQYKNVDQWVQCFNAPNVTLPQVAYLGFSAHCGELSGTSLSPPAAPPPILIPRRQPRHHQHHSQQPLLCEPQPPGPRSFRQAAEEHEDSEGIQGAYRGWKLDVVLPEVSDLHYCGRRCLCRLGRVQNSEAELAVLREGDGRDFHL